MNKVRLMFVGMIAVFIGATLWYFSDYTPQYPTAGNSVVVFGDSLAKGVGSTEGNDIASRLQTALNRPVLNLGVSGDTTAEGLARVDLLMESEPRVVIILLGGNDAIRRVSVEDTFSNLDQIITRIKEVGAGVVLVGEPGGFYGSRYEKEYGRLARKHRTFYVSNILSGLIGHSEYMSDYIHPNDIGYEKATERILPIVEEALSK